MYHAGCQYAPQMTHFYSRSRRRFFFLALSHDGFHVSRKHVRLSYGIYTKKRDRKREREEKGSTMEPGEKKRQDKTENAREKEKGRQRERETRRREAVNFSHCRVTEQLIVAFVSLPSLPLLPRAPRRLSSFSLNDLRPRDSSCKVNYSCDE